MFKLHVYGCKEKERLSVKIAFMTSTVMQYKGDTYEFVNNEYVKKGWFNCSVDEVRFFITSRSSLLENVCCLEFRSSLHYLGIQRLFSRRFAIFFSHTKITSK